MTVFLALTAALFIGPGDHGPPDEFAALAGELAVFRFDPAD
ncbi:MAG: hypothetical protein ACXWZI_17630 [Mycobacterium sp.]